MFPNQTPVLCAFGCSVFATIYGQLLLIGFGREAFKSGTYSDSHTSEPMAHVLQSPKVSPFKGAFNVGLACCVVLWQMYLTCWKPILSFFCPVYLTQYNNSVVFTVRGKSITTYQSLLNIERACFFFSHSSILRDPESIYTHYTHPA